MAYLANEKRVVSSLDAMTSFQRTAFPLLLADYCLGVIEPIDAERASRMSPALAIDYLYLPRIEPHLARCWRQLLGLPAEPTRQESSSSVSTMFPEGSLARRFSELHLDASSNDGDLTSLAMRANEPAVSSAILVVEIAVKLGGSEQTGFRIVNNIDYALAELHEASRATSSVDASVDTCLALAAELDGTPETAFAARRRARAAGMESFIASAH